MKLFNGVCNSQARLDGKTAVVTGCNTGIGKETALDFVKRGARVVMACRDLKKADEAAEDIRKQTAGLERVGEIVVTKLDLGSLASVRECAKHLLRTEPRINLLINNAGVMGCPKGRTEDGFETHLGVNHLGHFLFTCLLLRRILRSAPARIVTVSSLAHLFGYIDFDDLNWEKSYNTTAAYGRSKLANILFTMELAARLQGTEVTTYSLHPGIVSTELVRNFDSGYFWGAKWICNTVMKLFFKTPKQGAQTTIYCAVDESLDKESGLYYSDCAKEMLLAKSRVEEVAKRLWTESARMVGLGEWDPFTAPDEDVGNIDFDDLNWEKSYNTTAAYARSKLANILFTMELAARLQGTDVTTYALHPGIVSTGIFRNLDKGYFWGATWLWNTTLKIFRKTPKQGAQTTIYCAVDESLNKESGLYYSDCAKETPSAKARDEEVAKRLWTESARMVGLREWDPFTAPDEEDTGIRVQRI